MALFSSMVAWNGHFYEMFMHMMSTMLLVYLAFSDYLYPFDIYYVSLIYVFSSQNLAFMLPTANVDSNLPGLQW